MGVKDLLHWSRCTPIYPRGPVLAQCSTECIKFRHRQRLNAWAHGESHVAAVHEPELLQAQVLHGNFH